MSSYTVALVAHVLVAVLGAGQVASIAVGASTARRAGVDLSQAVRWLRPLLRLMGISMGLMLVTGVWIARAAGGGYQQLWWFRLSMILLLATFFVHRRAVAALNRTQGTDEAGAFRRLERAAWLMCASVASITVLMEAKPF